MLSLSLILSVVDSFPAEDILDCVVYFVVVGVKKCSFVMVCWSSLMLMKKRSMSEGQGKDFISPTKFLVGKLSHATIKLSMIACSRPRPA